MGLLYSAFTYYTGFKVNSGEYKIMGLAPYGMPRYARTIRDNLIDVKDDGSYRLNMDYFDYCAGLTMTNSKFDQIMAIHDARTPGTFGYVEILNSDGSKAQACPTRLCIRVTSWI
mgnify:CR=1 FL=1